MLDQDDKENIRMANANSENSELTQDEWKLLTWYREVPEADQGYILRIARSLAAL